MVNMIALAFVVMMQTSQPQTSYLVSTRAGLVNYVQGSATVKAATSIPEGKPISTGPGGAVEILLNPGSYLRMGESTTVVLEKVDLSDITVRILQGSAVVEANGVDKELPLTINTGKLKMEIIKNGIYLFANGKVVVVDGKIRDASNGNLVYGKGFQISDDQGYRAQKVKTFTTELELWSQRRDEQIAQANVNIANSLRQSRGLTNSLLDVWLWAPAYASFIYMPGGRYRSPYGYVYQAVGRPYYDNYRGGGSQGSASASGGGGGFGGGGSSSSNASSGGGGGGSVSYSSGIQSSGGGTSNPSPTPSAGAQAGAPVGRSTIVGK